MANLDVIKIIEKARGSINTRYDMDTIDIRAILTKRHSEPVGVAIDSFAFGYIQGVKATKAEMKRKAKKAVV